MPWLLVIPNDLCSSAGVSALTRVLPRGPDHLTGHCFTPTPIIAHGRPLTSPVPTPRCFRSQGLVSGQRIITHTSTAPAEALQLSQSSGTQFTHCWSLASGVLFGPWLDVLSRRCSGISVVQAYPYRCRTRWSISGSKALETCASDLPELFRA